MTRFKADVVTIDFETEAIKPRPEYPPKPVGVSIREPSGKSTYYAWGHPIENNSTRADAIRALKKVWGKTLVFHNSKFDLEVAEKHLGLLMPPWQRIHDTMYLLFLTDPHARNLKLKESAQRVLGMNPEEQDAVRQWLIDQKIVKKTDGKWGAHICDAPGKLVGKYAKGDTTRTYRLYSKLWKEVSKADMLDSYDTERQVMPILLRNEQQGVKVNIKALRKDAEIYASELMKVDNYLRKALKCKNLNVDAKEEVANALDEAGVVTEWILTKTNKKSMAKDNLSIDMFHNPRIAMAYAYRTRLQTCTATFLNNWLEIAGMTGGTIFTNWNQVRQQKVGFSNSIGARTGRLSSTPNFMNIPTDFYDKGDSYKHPTVPKGLTELPMMRRYILPDKGHVFGHRDYDQQELRILAYFEEAGFYQAYLDNPAMDAHVFVQDLILQLANMKLNRKSTKIINFGIIYGMGLEKLGKSLECSKEEARVMRNAHKKSLPGVADLEKEIKLIGKSGECIVTWGGRKYYTEEPRLINGRMQTFEYKLLNYLIQGSAADCTKRALINYDEIQKANDSEARFLITVHDEINVSLPKDNKKQEMMWVKEAMETVDFGDMVICSTGGIGKDWASVKDYKVPGDIK